MKLEERLILSVAAALSVFWIFLLINFIPLVNAHSSDNTNVSSDPGEYWGWNDIIGWIDHHSTHTVFLTASKLKGYASSTAGDITFDCATSRTGSSLCNTSNFAVNHNGDGALSGWAWNDVYGWISFCGGQGTSDCPGTSISYQVEVDLATGRFKGNGTSYAWNDAIGWISFNCLNHDFPACDYEYYVEVGAATSTVGVLESTPFDTEVRGGAQINSVMWKGDLPSGSSVYFQFAASNSSSGPWSFTGSDGTEATYFGPVNPNTSYKVGYSLYNNKRYFKYKLFIYSDASQLRTPRVDDISINWSP